ncbi:MAG: formate dehydrogenase accessory sulfurtransferase FdhD [Flavobacteriales bacterium]|nr:formate dehydrogenase accessory sulfurtransferase FdhD [Flavobacteriales bacterium]
MPTSEYQSYRLSPSGTEHRQDALVMEESLAIQVNNAPFSVTMRTPGMEQELVIGLLRGEGVLGDRDTFTFGECHTNERNFVDRIDIEIPNLDTRALINKRTLLSNASCGICGNRELEIPSGEQLESGFQFEASMIPALYAILEDRQNAFIRSGGSHAAAIFDGTGGLMAMAEDVGRHNAVDKAVGRAILDHHLANARFLLVSGRISYEIVAKCFKARIPVLAAVSAPSSLAVDYAKEFGITLLAFCRDKRCTVFSAPNRIKALT